MTKNETDQLDPALRRLIAILIIGAMAPLLDTTIVNVALNTLARDLATTVSTVQWVSTSYLLAMGMAIPLAGWAATRIGGKQTWLVSLGLFLVSSALAGAAWDIGSLIAFRVLQGIASGVPSAPARRGSVDVLGAVAVTAGLALAVFAVVRAPEVGWSSAATWGSLAGAVALLIVFVVFQRLRAVPLVRLGIFRTPNLG